MRYWDRASWVERCGSTRRHPWRLWRDLWRLEGRSGRVDGDGDSTFESSLDKWVWGDWDRAWSCRSVVPWVLS